MAVDAIKRLLEIKKTGLIVIGIGGPTGAGKTTLAHRISGMINGTKILSMRNYYNSVNARRGSGGAKTLIYCDRNNSPEFVNIDDLVKDLKQLMRGKAVQTPHFNYHSRRPDEEQTKKKFSPPASRVLIIEGIYAVGETVILLHLPLPAVGVSIVMERRRQQNDSLAADG